MTLGKGAACALDVTSVDIDPAHQRLAVGLPYTPARETCRFEAGEVLAYLHGDAGSWEAFVVNTYSNSLTLPQHLLTTEFYRLLPGCWKSRPATSTQSEAIAEQYVAALGPRGAALSFLSTSWSRMATAASLLAPRGCWSDSLGAARVRAGRHAQLARGPWRSTPPDALRPPSET